MARAAASLAAAALVVLAVWLAAGDRGAAGSVDREVAEVEGESDADAVAPIPVEASRVVIADGEPPPPAHEVVTPATATRRRERPSVRVRVALPGETEAHDPSSPRAFVDADLALWGAYPGDEAAHGSGDPNRPWRHDSGDADDGPVVLEFDGDVRRGWVTLRHGPLEYDDGRAVAFLDAEQPGARADAVGFRTGIPVEADDDIVVLTVAPGEVVGTVALTGPHGEKVFEGSDARVRVVSSRSPTPTWATREELGALHMIANVEPDGSFRVENVEPGVVRVEVIRSGNLALATIEGVIVPNGAPTADPRLFGIDVDHHCQRYALRVVDTNGEPIDEPRATVVDRCGEDPFVGSDGVVVVRVPNAAFGSDSPSIVVTATGFAPVRLDRPVRETTVTLVPLHPVGASTLELFESETNSHGFMLRLTRTDVPLEVRHHFSVDLPWHWKGATEEQLELPGPGRYQLEVKVLQRMGSLLGHTPYDRYVPTGSFVDVAPGDTRILLDVPDDLLRFQAPR